MSNCGCGNSFFDSLLEGLKLGVLFGGFKGGGVGGLFGISGGPVGIYVGGIVGGAIGGTLGGLSGAGSTWLGHALFGQCGRTPVCLCLPGRYKTPSATPPNVDPLILDLDRDGKDELKNATFFDLDANGFKEYTRWIGDTDAFLVLDNDLNGELDDGGELFGDAMILPDGRRALTGFDALRAFDSNGDGKIDASDEIWASLKVVTGAGEMAS